MSVDHVTKISLERRSRGHYMYFPPDLSHVIFEVQLELTRSGKKALWIATEWDSRLPAAQNPVQTQKFDLLDDAREWVRCRTNRARRRSAG